jgi:CelD/BcsL family acetyltransferase involved in cellulose biosynthesis
VTVETHHSFDALADEWHELAARVEAPPWVRPEWIRAWWTSFGRGQPEVIAVRSHDTLEALAPLVRHRGVLRSPTNWHTPEFVPLAETDEARGALAGALWHAGARRVELAFLAESAWVDAARRTARDAGHVLLERVLVRSPFVPIEGAWEDYVATLDRRLVSELKRRRRRLSELGEVSTELVDGSEHLADAFRIEASGWKGARGTAIASQPETRHFYTAVAEWAAREGLLRLAFLRLGDRRIAFRFNLEQAGRLYALKSGYDEEFAKFSPGSLLVFDLLEYAFRHELRSYELLGTETPSKREWTDRSRVRLLFQSFARSPAGLVDWAAFRYGRPAAKQVLARVRR